MSTEHIQSLVRQALQLSSNERAELDRMDAINGIKRGLQSMKSSAGKPAAEFFREFFAENGIAEEE
jgi:hypothetical protein